MNKYNNINSAYFTVFFFLFIFYTNHINAQYLISGSNLYASAQFIEKGTNNSSFVVGTFLSYEQQIPNTPSLTNYQIDINDTIKQIDSCGYNHFTNKLFVAKILESGKTEWIRTSNSCDTLSRFTITETASDDKGNLYVLGVYKHSFDFETLQLTTSAHWDMFLLKISPKGDVLWTRSGFASSSGSSVVPSDLAVLAGNVFISGYYNGNASFAGDVLSSTNDEFFLLQTDTAGNDIEMKAGLDFGAQAHSYLEEIDINSLNTPTGILNVQDSILIVHSIAGVRDTISTFRAFDSFYLYLVDTTNVLDKLTVLDTIYKGTPADTLYLVDYTNIADISLIKDSIINYIPTISEHIYISSFIPDSITIVSEPKNAPDVFKIDRSDNDRMYGLYNFSGNLIFENTTIPSSPNPSFAIVEFDTQNGISWYKKGSCSTDTVSANEFFVFGEKLYLSGSVGRIAGTHQLVFDGKTYEQSYDEDGFILKIDQGQTEWFQMLGDSASDRINDFYATDEFTIYAAGEYSKMIDYDGFHIESSGKKDIFVGAINPFPMFDLTVNSNYNENLPLCEGDSILLVAKSSHDCSFQWMKDSVAIAGASDDSLWVFSSGSYFMEATSNVIVRPDLTAFSKKSVSFTYTFNPYPNKDISIFDTTVFCAGGLTVLDIEVVKSDSCSWSEINTGFISSGRNITVDSSGLYFARIEGSTGCVSYSDSIEITVVPLPDDSVAIMSSFYKFCAGDSLEIHCFDAGNNLYTWYNDGDSLTTSSQSSYFAKNSGNYAVDIVNDHNCKTSVTGFLVTEIVPPQLNYWFSADASGICAGDSAEFRIESYAETQYIWFKNNDTIHGMNSNIMNIKDQGDYRVKVVKSDVCMDSTEVMTLTVNPLPVVNISISGDSSICSNESVWLMATNSANFDYIWFKNETQINGQINDSLNVTSFGSYYAQVTNQYSCVASTRPVQVSVKNAPDVSLFSNENKLVFCANDSLRLYVHPYQSFVLEWLKDDIPTGDTGGDTYISSAGSYSVIVSDTSTNCSTETNNIAIQKIALPDATIQQDAKSLLCDGDTVLLNAASGDFTYRWFANNNLLPLNTTNQLKVAHNGQFYLEITDTNNCRNISSYLQFDFLENPVPPIQQEVEFLSTRLYNQVQWYKNGQLIDGADEQVYLVTESGQYFVEVTHPNNCVARSTQMQVCVPFPDISFVRNEITATEGEMYQWFFGTDTIFGANEPVYYAQQTGDYSVDITLADNCVSRSKSVHICYPVPQIEIQPNNVLKSTLGLEYQWYRDDVALEGSDARLLVVNLEGNYKVEVTDLDGCTSFSDPVFLNGTAISSPGNSSFIIYPNPFTDALQVILDEHTILGNAVISIYNTSGQLVFKTDIISEETRIIVPELPSGTYKALIINNEKEETYWLIKK